MSAPEDDDHAADDPHGGPLAAGRELLGKFRLGSLQRRSACSEIREATHLILGRAVLVWSRTDLEPGSPLAARFVAAMETLARLRERALLDVYEAFDLEHGVGAVTEVVTRPTLADELDDRPGVAWSPSAARSWIVPTLRALDAVHAHGLVHGRLSPTSVIRTRDGVRLVDLVDLRLDAPSLTTFDPPPADDLRRLAPEWIAEPDEVGPAADIYSVGCLLFRLLTGREPFPDNDPHVLMTAHLGRAPADGEVLVAGLDEGMTRIIQRALSKHPGYRFESAREMAEAVDKFSTYLRPVAIRKPPWSDRADLVASRPEAPAPTESLSEPLLDAADTAPDVHPPAPALGTDILDDDEAAAAADIYARLEIDGVDVDTPGDAGVLVGSRVVPKRRDAPGAPRAADPRPAGRAPFDPLATQPGITPVARVGGVGPARPPDARPRDRREAAPTAAESVPEPTPTPAELAVTPPEPSRPVVAWRPPSVEARTATSSERTRRMPSMNVRVRLVWLAAGAGLMLAVLLVVWLAQPRLGDDATLEVDESSGHVRELLGGEVVAGADMVVVPGGVARIGGGHGATLAETRLDSRAVYVSPFAIDRLEVTVGAYEACVASGLCEPRLGTAATPEHDRQPVTRVTWRGADAFCRSRGKRLPTEAEWEKAARGTTGRSYPWGDAPDCRRAQVGDARCGASSDAPEPVGARPTGASPWGVEQMADNVWEWTADWYAEPDWHAVHAASADPVGPTSGPGRVVKGGDFASGPRTAAARAWNAVEAASERGGFRCAVSLPGAERQGRVELFGSAPRLDRRLDNYLLGGEGGPVLARPRRP